jgi:hypothetical protein
MERVLDFQELKGSYSGENMAQVVDSLLQELDLGSKLLTITSNNTKNNETMISELYSLLMAQFDIPNIDPSLRSLPVMRFEGLQSYIRCIAYILNLICIDILKALKSGDNESASQACDNIRDKKSLELDLAPLFRLRIIVLWIDRHLQCRQR